MKPPKQSTPRNLPRIDWPNLADKALEELRRLVEAERERRWFARRPRSPVDDLYDSGRAPHPAHAEAFDTYYCRSHGMRRISRGELLQEERDETFVYVCTLCGQVADPTPLFSPAPVQAGAGPGHITSVLVQGAELRGPVREGRLDDALLPLSETPRV
jgi:hypothetical protein